MGDETPSGDFPPPLQPCRGGVGGETNFVLFFSPSGTSPTGWYQRDAGTNNKIILPIIKIKISKLWENKVTWNNPPNIPIPEVNGITYNVLYDNKLLYSNIRKAIL